MFTEIGVPFLWAVVKVKNRVRAFYYVFVIAAINSIVAWMKLVYAAPRPFWIPIEDYDSYGAIVTD